MMRTATNENSQYMITAVYRWHVWTVLAEVFVLRQLSSIPFEIVAMCWLTCACVNASVKHQTCRRSLAVFVLSYLWKLDTDNELQNVKM